MQVSRWRNVFIFKNSFFPSSNLASFHSTPAFLDRRKSKWNFVDAQKGQQPSKNYIRYSIRQKRADAKKALKDLLYKGYSKFQEDEPTWKCYRASTNKQYRPKKARNAGQGHQNGRKCKHRKGSFSDDDSDENQETIFRATFGGRCYSWSFGEWGNSHFQSSTSGFEWRDQTNRTNNYRNWDSSSETDSDDESFEIGSYSDRKVLGLPLRGPLKIGEVKAAFHSSALKWHPDKHQGSSQAMAAEKFKVCVNAYKSLCTALSSG